MDSGISWISWIAAFDEGNKAQLYDWATCLYKGKRLNETDGNKFLDSIIGKPSFTAVYRFADMDEMNRFQKAFQNFQQEFANSEGK